MRLLHTTTLQLKLFVGRRIPPYCILSHTWTEGELTYQNLNSLLSENLFTCLLSIYSKKPVEFVEILQADGKLEVPDGLIKVLKFCELAREEQYEWAWIDSCCIDKESSAELSEAINSMYRYYQQAQTCWVHLADIEGGATIDDEQIKDEHHSFLDVPGKSKNARAADRSKQEWTVRKAPENFGKSKWFTRGWTLQELLAPTYVKFCDKHWSFIGTKGELSHHISKATGIDESILVSVSPTRMIAQRSIAERMSWASNRETTRIEDIAYSLLGIFDIQMSLLYGEGEKAFLRLQKKIAKVHNDETIFAWDWEDIKGPGDFRGILAPHPRAFLNSGTCTVLDMSCDPVFFRSHGVGFPIYNHPHLTSNTLRTTLPLNCTRDGQVIAISLAKLGGVWYRVIGPESSLNGLHKVGHTSTERFLPPTYNVREPLYISISSSPVPTTDHVIGVENELGLNAVDGTDDTGREKAASEDILSMIVAIRFTTHFIPWSCLVKSVDVSTANKMVEHHPAITKFERSMAQASLIEMTDTGKEVVVGPFAAPPITLTPVAPSPQKALSDFMHMGSGLDIDVLEDSEESDATPSRKRSISTVNGSVQERETRHKIMAELHGSVPFSPSEGSPASEKSGVSL